MLQMFVALGLQPQDALLLFCCPIAAAMGTMTQMAVQGYDLQKIPTADPQFASLKLIGFRIGWIAARLFVGVMIGLVLALYFVGALQPSITTTAKLIALSILAGFAAPKLWIAQEQAVVDHVLEHLRKDLSVVAGRGSVTLPKAPVVPQVPRA